MLKSYLYRIIITLTGHLPLWVLRALGHLIGTVLRLSRSRMWLVTLENIERCYPGLDHRRQYLLAKESLQETGKTITETTYAWSQNVDTVMGLIHSVDGQAEVETALAENKGVIFVIPHLGNWEIINHFLGRNYGLTHMYQPNRIQPLEAFIQQQRNRTGTRFVPTNSSGIRSQLKTLKAGGCIGVMPDQEPLIHTGQFAPFFGIDALTNELVVGFSRGGAKMFVAVCERTSSGFGIRFDQIDPDDISQTATSLSAVNRGIEDAVRRKPAQYLWSYKRFRTRPAGNLDFYNFDKHPLRTLFERLILKFYLLLFRYLPTVVIRPLSSLLARLPFLAAKRRKVSKINLGQCGQNPELLGPSMARLFQSALEAPYIWRTNSSFISRLAPIIGNIRPNTGTIVLTPPLGSREALLKYLGNEFFVTEYYHPNTINSLDEVIRMARHSQGIQLVEHDDLGRAHLVNRLSRGHVVTLCPDQQPRLRGGIFVPFFGISALTTKILPELLRETGADLVIGSAQWQGKKYQISLERVEYDPGSTDEELLLAINRQLETTINQDPQSYRWSDKRFNIQPLGRPKIYR